MIGFSLNIIASILTWVLQPFCFTFGFFASIRKKEFKKWQIDLAYVKDLHGNVLIKYLANLVLIKKDGYKFGDKKRTISYVLGVNKLKGTLTGFGKLICIILNKIDKNHVENAVKE